MQPESVNSDYSAHNGRPDGPPRQAQREMPRLSIRHSFSREASSRRKKIFCLCILCWLMVLCLTGIIIIAVVHFQSSDSKIDQISAGALIGFGLLLIVVLGWSAIVYSRFQKRSSPRRDSSRRTIPREEMLAIASSEIYTRGASTISTNNSLSHSDSSSEGNTHRFIYRDRHRDDERRFVASVNTRYMVAPPAPPVQRSTRMVREYPGVVRPQVLHFPERPRLYPDPSRQGIEPDRPSGHFRRYSNPLPPPYLPPIAVTRPISESLPMGFPPPAYDRVVGRRRRCESTASEESTLYPPDYQSTPPSPSNVQNVAPAERRTSLNVPPEQPRIDLGIQISSTLPPLRRATRLDSSSSQEQPTHLPSSGVSPGGSVLYNSPSRLSPVPQTAAQLSTSSLARYYRSTAPHFLSPPNSSTSPLLSPMSVSSRGSESPARSHTASPVYLTNSRSPFRSRSMLSLTAPENTIPESVDHEEQEENEEESRNDTTSSGNRADEQAPNVVLVYLSQSQEEEIVV